MIRYLLSTAILISTAACGPNHISNAPTAQDRMREYRIQSEAQMQAQQARWASMTVTEMQAEAAKYRCDTQCQIWVLQSDIDTLRRQSYSTPSTTTVGGYRYISPIFSKHGQIVDQNYRTVLMR